MSWWWVFCLWVEFSFHFWLSSGSCQWSCSSCDSMPDERASLTSPSLYLPLLTALGPLTNLLRGWVFGITLSRYVDLVWVQTMKNSLWCFHNSKSVTSTISIWLLIFFICWSLNWDFSPVCVKCVCLFLFFCQKLNSFIKKKNFCFSQ